MALTSCDVLIPGELLNLSVSEIGIANEVDFLTGK